MMKSGEAKEHTPASLGEPISYRYSAFQFVFAIAYAAFVLYVTGIYAHGWIEKLQMLPLCVVAVVAPTLWAIMIRKQHG